MAGRPPFFTKFMFDGQDIAALGGRDLKPYRGDAKAVRLPRGKGS